MEFSLEAWNYVLSHALVILFCLAVTLDPPITYIEVSEACPIAPVSRPVEIITMGEKRDSILLHLPKK